MSVQFPEHADGKQSSDPKISKLDKLGKLLGVRFQVDGVQYGGSPPEPITDDMARAAVSRNEKSEPIVVKKQPTTRKKTK